MPVSPIDYGRYGHPEMKQIFEEEYRHSLWLNVEVAVAEAQAQLSLIPREAAEDIMDTAIPKTVTLERTMEIEAETRHDVAALIEAIAEKCKGKGARWVHFGLTSNDVKDTALGLQLKAAFKVIMKSLRDLGDWLASRAMETTELVAVGRSHGQHAVPITYGLRFAVWLNEITRHRRRLMEAEKMCRVGKVSGATGSHAVFGAEGMELQKMILDKLGLTTPVATTQIVQRDRLAHAISSLANLASSIDKMATDLRALQRTEIAETYEPFAKEKQVGSSAMPHKRNPVICEKLSGLARVVRSLVPPALENVVSWEERDISHSSTERFIVPQAFILTDYLVREMTRVIEGLAIDEKAVTRNLALSSELVMSEFLVTLLIRAGMERPKAHEKLRRLSSVSKETGKGLLELVKSDTDIGALIKPESLDMDAYHEGIVQASKMTVHKAVEVHRASLSNPTE